MGYVTRWNARTKVLHEFLMYENNCCSFHIGQYWGEMGYFRIAMGGNLLGIEGEVAWATPGAFTINNFPCSEDGKNCNSNGVQYYVDPSEDVEAVQRRLMANK